MFFVRVADQAALAVPSGEGRQRAAAGRREQGLHATFVALAGRAGRLGARRRRSVEPLAHSRCRTVPAPQLPSDPAFRPCAISWFPDSRHIVIAEEARDLIGSRIVLSDTRSAARHLVLSSVDWIQGATVEPRRPASRLLGRARRTGHPGIFRRWHIRPHRRGIVDARRFSRVVPGRRPLHLSGWRTRPVRSDLGGTRGRLSSVCGRGSRIERG